MIFEPVKMSPLLFFG